MTVYQPVCTCHVPGIYGCLLHEYGQQFITTDAMTTEEVAKVIVDGGAFTDQDAVRVAKAYLRSLNHIATFEALT